MEQIIEQIQNEIAKGRVKNGIKILIEQTKGKMPEIYDEALALSNRLNTLERKSRLGIISNAEERVERAQITSSLLSITSQLNESTPQVNGIGGSPQVDPDQNRQVENINKLKWDEFLRWLNRILAGHVYKTDDIRSLATSFGLPVIAMNWDSNARTHWFNVLEYYVKRDENGEKKEDLLSIIKYVIDNYGDGPNLQKALDWAMPKVVEKELKEEEYNAKVGEGPNFEKLMKKGVNTLLPIWFLETGIERGKSVGRIETAEQYGTGFLLKNNYLLTNNHVIQNKEEALDAVVEMNFEEIKSGGIKKKKKYTFDLSKEEYFATSIENDWTIIKVKEDANKEWGYIELKKMEGIKAGDRVVIIQHPEGDPKRIGLHNNFITFVDDDMIMYLTDTMEGSSGSPVFNQNWELVGLHNKGGYLREPTTMAKVWRNGGININRVLLGIQNNNIPGF